MKCVKKCSLSFSCLFLLATFVVVQSVDAAPVSFSVTPLFDDGLGGGIPESSVLNDNIVAAVNAGQAADRTVNGVLFAGTIDGDGGDVPTTGGSVSVTTGPITIAYETGYSDRVFPNALPSGDFRELLRSNATSAGDGTTEMTISGLTIGSDYRAQFLMSTDNGSSRSQKIVSGVDESAEFTTGTGGTFSVLANFTADSVTQAFSLASTMGQRSTMASISLAEFGAPVPEPTSLALLGMVGVLGLGARRRI
ncbi:PEP-CTERM sorting domain-containing protein [Adhaeretor mobilis]|uniref:Ice-binding protein C-terminal domain-containing protein n=1 Tax=Adhaeretor mobilis TaxID=1930276 RepID=A0A517MPW3_9BACT|nr:PEP-CTERM sorting domain-containing protein [Adhaeretor mobilis]QDS96920.1 hypothetical protein HG15A2_01790 [Adhaeretor mobilis]